MPTIKPINGRYFVKWLHSGHYAAAADIECDSCENFWNYDIIQYVMRGNHRVGGYVICDLDFPIGYVVFENSRVNRELIISNLVVRSDYRNMGVGRILVDRLISKLNSPESPRPPRQITACVRESNLGAHLFFKKCGFIAKDVEKEYFEDVYFGGEEIKMEDAYKFVFSF